jgi:alpha,alpha-trehalase
MASPVSPRKTRTSNEIDPYSAAHIYYGAEATLKSKNLFRARTYSSVSRDITVVAMPSNTDMTNLQNQSSVSALNGLFEPRKPKRRGSHGKPTLHMRHSAYQLLMQLIR